MKSYTILEKALNGETLKDTLIVDCHGHLDHWKAAVNIGVDIDSMIDRMDRIGIDMACINKWNCPEIRRANDDVGAAIRKYPDRVAGFAVNTPSMGRQKTRDELKRCFEELGFKGVKVHNGYETQMPLRDQIRMHDYADALEAIWEFVDEQACPVLCHGYLTPNTAKQYPNGKFIAAHACGQRGNADNYADCPNVYFDTACSGVGRGSIEYIVKRVGAERVLYGSDLPYADPAYRIGQTIGTRLTDDVLIKVLGQNMAALLGLE